MTRLETLLIGQPTTVIVDHPVRGTRIRISGRLTDISATLGDLGLRFDEVEDIWHYSGRQTAKKD